MCGFVVKKAEHGNIQIVMGGLPYVIILAPGPAIECSAGIKKDVKMMT